MKVIGLCGQSGSGKGLVCSFFNEINVVSIDTDQIYHNIISTNSDCTGELVSCFGEFIFADPGIDRKKLGMIAFASKENLDKLNEITHRHILGEVRTTISRIKRENSADGIIVDAPLLFESGFDKECDMTVAVITDPDTKIARIMARDGITRDAAIKRLSSQISDQELISRCDHVIYNSQDPDDLRNRVHELKKILFD